MKYICAQPATIYFGWQIDVMLHSFVTTGVNLSDVQIVCSVQGKIDGYFSVLKDKYPDVEFFYYEDTRHDKNYISSIRPHILRKHFYANSYLSNEIIMYHDCDIAFTKPLILPCEVYEDDVCYLSDTISYIGHDYITSKGEVVLETMCNIVGIEKEIVKNNQESSGGAQYIMKGIDHNFWFDVENDCSRLHKEITVLNSKIVEEKKDSDPNYNPLQIWCADMWGVLWNLWKRNKKTKVIDELNFSWSVYSDKDWHKSAIYHNAGVTRDHKDLFYKGEYTNKLPDLNLNVKKDTCSAKYYRLIQQVL